MKFCAIAALCTAPLALAGTLQADLAARGAVEMEARRAGKDMMMDSSKDGMGPQGNSRGSNSESGVIIEQSVTADVLIIWVNNGGGAATSTVTDTVTVTAGGTSATHSVSLAAGWFNCTEETLLTI